MEFRPRDRTKDIQPEMYFKSRPIVENNAQRLEKSLHAKQLV